MNILLILGSCLFGLVFMYLLWPKPKKNPVLATSKSGEKIVILHQFKPCNNDAFSASPFCAKVEVFCRLFNIKYEVVNGMNPHSKTKKMPWIEFGVKGAEMKEITDSSTIINFLKSEFNIESTLTTSEGVISHFLHRMLDEHIYWTTVKARWLSEKSLAFLAVNYFGNSTQLFARFVVWISGMKAVLWGQGTGRYSEAEVITRLEADCTAISQVYILYYFNYSTSVLRKYFILPIFISVIVNNFFVFIVFTNHHLNKLLHLMLFNAKFDKIALSQQTYWELFIRLQNSKPHRCGLVRAFRRPS